MNLRFANELFRQEKYSDALECYKDILEEYPTFKEVIRANINICETMISNHQNDDNQDFQNVFAPLVDNGWVAVITLWKRSSYLREQLNAICGQTIKPNEIIIIQNENHFEIDKELIEEYGVKVVKSDINSLYTRWIIGYLSDSKYISVFDDDVIPGKKWIENCIRVCETHNALVGPSGRRAKLDKEPAWISVDIGSKNKENLSCTDRDVVCDWVCNSYFFKKEWIKYVVSAGRYLSTQKTFDDIQLATTLKFYGGIKTVVPQQSKDNLDFNGHIKREYGHDEFALWKRQSSEHANKRTEFIRKLNQCEQFTWNSVEKHN